MTHLIQTEPRVLAAIEPTEATLGRVYSMGSPGAEELARTALKEWHNPLYHDRWQPWSCWAFDRDEGQPVLQHTHSLDGILLTREKDWTDYSVSIRLRTFSRRTESRAGNGLSQTARYGVILRFQDFHRYYFYCIEGNGRLVLYRREDMIHFTELAARPLSFDAANYHDLRATIEGTRISCFLDDQLIFSVEDSSFAKGAAGIRFCGIAAVRKLQVTTDEIGWANIQTERTRTAAELDRLRLTVPQPELARRISLPSPAATDGTARLRFADLRGTGTKDIVAVCDSPKGGQALTALSAQGETIWEVGVKNFRGYYLADFDRDGRDELVTFGDGMLRILDGETGTTLQETPLPAANWWTEPTKQGATFSPDSAYPCQLRKAPAPPDILLTETAAGGARHIYVYDAQLRQRFSICFEQPPYGHNAFCHDLDGDGRDEILVGHRLVDGDGNILWTVEGAKEEDMFGPGRHADSVSCGWKTDDPADGYFCALSCGDDGLLLVDAKDGRILARQHIGHVQGHSIAKYRKDLPGMQVLCGTRHNGYGILALVDSQGNVLHRWQPDFRSQGGYPINWKGDGEEYLALYSTPEAMGVWDAWGRMVVAPPAEVAGGAMLQPQPLVAGESRDSLAFLVGNEILIYAPVGGEPMDGKVFAPIRAWDRNSTWVSFPRWQ